jgi:Ca-activated chloride channel family protein
MELAWPWLPPLLAGTGLAVALAVLGVSMVGARRERRGTRVGNIAVLSEQPAFRRVVRTYRALLVFAALAAVVSLGAAAFAASRPIGSSTITPETRNRDIVFCLDVSGSMTSFDAQLITDLESLARGFSGERIGLVLFDGSPLQVFPLTTDYEFVRAQLAEVKLGLSHRGEGYSFRDGTDVAGGSSRVGDGLAGCILQFDKPEAERSRTIVMGTDNHSGPDSLITLQQAREHAVDRGIAVYGLNPDHDEGGRTSVEYQREMEATGGAYYPTETEADSRAVVAGIVRSVMSDPATVIVDSPIRTTTDHPEPAIWLLVAGTALLLLLVWRVKL